MAITFQASDTDTILARLEKIDEDATPLWGGMSAPQMRSHLRTALRYSLGKEEPSPDESSFVNKYILVPLLLSGTIKIPKNVKGPAMYDAALPTASVEELKAELDEYMVESAKSDFNPPKHPSLGDLGPIKWGKLHAVHMDHHLRQFGV